MLHLKGISKQYGSNVLFQDAEANLTHRSRVALIGPNGAGKSTLIRIILGLESADSGMVSRASHLVIGYLAQEVPRMSDRSVLQEAMSLDGRREELIKTREEIELQFAHGEAKPEEMDRYGRILEELEALDEYRLEARAKQILSGLGFKLNDLERPLREFSGGWLMRVALAKVLLMEPDLILLDEPTNHLDLESLLWLEEFLLSFRGAILLVSHDRAFLNRMVGEVIEIDQRKLNTYRGNLDSYAIQKQERLTVLKAQYEGQQSRIAEIEDFVRRFGAKATKARQAQSRMKELERMDRIEMPEDRSNVRFRFPPAPHSGKEVVTLKKVGLSYGDTSVFSGMDWVLRKGSRVAIVGVNGAGKTTLLKLLGHKIPATSGEVKLGHQVQVGYYAQHQGDELDRSKTVLQVLEAIAPEMPVSQVRAIAGAFLFTGDAVHKKCGVLSGGEKARVALARLLLSPSNLLLLDEPTNHLDIESRGVLLDALQAYEGTLCLVSHDREFIGPLVDQVLEIEPAPQGSKVIPLLGTYEDYLARVERRIREASRGSGGSAPKAVRAVAEPAASSGVKKASNNQLRNWETERDTLEKEIAKLERRLSEVSAQLSDSAVYEDKPRAMTLIEEQTSVQRAMEQKLTRWEEVCHLLGREQTP